MEADMLHESDNENHEEEEEDMVGDFDIDDVVLWGEAGGSDDDSGEDNEMESDDDDDDDDGDEEGEGVQHNIHPRVAFNADGRPVLLHLGQLNAMPEFVRMTAGYLSHGAGERERRTNEDLVRSLKRHANITCKDVIKAFQVCSRDLFVPEDQHDEAFDDTPLRLDREFNISAPHMHGCMIQGLKIQPGDHILDVGSGCGVTTAMMAFLAGKEGKVVGVELRQYALNLSRAAIARVRKKKEYVARACEPTFEQGNAFILPEHEGLYDKVHVGGLCELYKLPILMKLLKPGTGRMVVPCESKLFCFKRTGDKVEREVLADVKFGELITPSDVEIVFGHLEHHRERLLTPEDHESNFEEEMASAMGRPVIPPPTAFNGEIVIDDADELDVHSSCTCGSFGLSSARSLMGRASLSSSGSPPTFTPCLSLPRTSSPGSPSALPTLPPYVTHGSPNPAGLAHALGPADCTVRGADFSLPVHSSVLQARCPVMHAQFTSGMRDADAREVTLPLHFTEAPVRAVLDYMYSNKVSLDEDTALSTLVVAVYLNMSHLIAQVSQFIISHLREQEVSAAVESAAQLHIFASEHGLDSLCRFCAAFLSININEARKAPSYKSLGTKELDEVLEAVASDREVVVGRLASLSCGLADLGDLSPKSL